MQNKRWTKKQPAEPGWYWMRRAIGEPMIVRIAKPWKDVLVFTNGSNSIIPMEIAHKDCEWCGPIDAPE